jgi:hypothetical protein
MTKSPFKSIFSTVVANQFFCFLGKNTTKVLRSGISYL